MELKDDILLDSEAFSNASTRLDNLARDMGKLRSDISGLLEELMKGFDTPAGHKFFTACDNALLKVLDDEVNVINHVSGNLKSAKTSYQSVFEGYQVLNTFIKNSK